MLWYVGRVLLLGPAFFLVAPACRHAPPKLNTTPPVIVEDVRLEGFDVLPSDEVDELLKELPIQSGAALTDEAEQATGNVGGRGAPEPRLSVRPGPDRARACRPEPHAPVVRAEPGARGFFGSIEIAGNRRVDDAIIRRRLAYAPGDLFRRTAIERSQQRIGALGLFKSVDIRAEKLDARPSEVPTIVTVDERSPWQWNLSLGYAAGEQLGVGARVSHLNFLGAARRLDLEGRVSRIDRQAERRPSRRRTRGTRRCRCQARRDTGKLDERAFYVLSRGGQAAITWRWTPEFASTVSYASAFERSRVDSSLELLTGLQDGMLNAWSVDLDHRRPSQILMMHVEQAGGWMPGTFNYYNLIGEARRYQSVLDDRVILAGRVRYGSIDPMASESDIPLLKRFFLGGSGEMRGWGRYELSPLSESGEAVGGKSLFTATAEARFPIFRRVRGAMFVEAGNVWQNAWSA